MLWLINYIRSCFCKHEWECLANDLGRYKKGQGFPYEQIWIYRCKKCGCLNKVTTNNISKFQFGTWR